jgi:hypothetical protein
VLADNGPEYKPVGRTHQEISDVENTIFSKCLLAMQVLAGQAARIGEDPDGQKNHVM